MKEDGASKDLLKIMVPPAAFLIDGVTGALLDSRTDGTNLHWITGKEPKKNEDSVMSVSACASCLASRASQ